MIYMVEHVFSMPELEGAWNQWYSANIRTLLGVPGFRTAQRFKAMATGGPPRYMALYTVESGAVFESAAYKNAGGGGTASARFRPAYQAWIRNLFESDSAAPAVGEDQRLLVFDAGAPEDFGWEGRPPLWLKSAGLHKTTPWRAIGVLAAADAGAASARHAGILYQPITTQLNS